MLFTALFISGVAATSLIDATQLLRRDDSEMNMKRYVDSLVEPVEIERRQSNSTLSPTTGVNVTAWDTQTTAACLTSLEALNGVASNPSGMAVCYNLPYLDNSTGVFEADLRLYMIAAPTGSFANVASSNVQVGLAYTGATVSAVNASSLKARSDTVTSLISWVKREEKAVKRVATPTLVQSYAFVGQVNQNLISANMGTAALQKVLVPAVTLSGVDPIGNKVNTTLSSDEATFVSGVFAQTLIPTKSKVVPPIQTLVVASESPFVVPGMNIIIFPIGAIITGIWTVALMATVAYGTVGRMQFRDQFRRRTAMATKGNLARI